MTDDAALSAEMRYFRAVEEALIAHRGAPLLLSAAEFQLARRWRDGGVPLRLIFEVMEDVISRRRARGEREAPNSLKYFARAIDKAWREIAQLGYPAPAGGDEPRTAGDRRPASGVVQLLENLARLLPIDLPRREYWALRINTLAETADVPKPDVDVVTNMARAPEPTAAEPGPGVLGDPPGARRLHALENQLAQIERELFDELVGTLSDFEKHRLSTASVDGATAHAERLDGRRLEALREQLWQRTLRERFHLPRFSLYTAWLPVADPGDAVGGPSAR